jgi:hypothetical protein
MKKMTNKKYLLDFFRHTYDQLSIQKTVEYESRKELIVFLLKTMTTISILLSSGWIVLVTSSTEIIFNFSLFLVFSSHIAVVLVCVLTTFTLILAHTWSKCLHEDLAAEWNEVLSSGLVAKELNDEIADQKYLDLLQKFNQDDPFISNKWSEKIESANWTAWFLGSLALCLFIVSIILDIRQGYLISKSNEAKSVRQQEAIPKTN